MRNSKVSTKLITGFLIVAILAAIVGAVGIIGMMNMDSSSNEMYNQQTVPLPYMSNVTTLMQRLRVNMREYALGVVEDDTSKIETAKSSSDQYLADIDEYLSLYDPTITSSEARTLFDEARSLFNNSYKPYLNQSYQYAKAGDLEGILQVLNDAKADTNKIVENFDRCLEIKVENAAKENSEISAQASTLLILIIVVLVIAVVIAMFLAFYNSRIISKPLVALTDYLKRVSETGNMTLSKEDEAVIGNYSLVRDETGQCIKAAAAFVNRLLDIGEVQSKIADGDLTAELSLLSGEDTMGISLNKMMDNLNNMFGEIKSSAAQVSTGSKQIADGAQSLAQGSTEQAAAVQQLSASIGEIAEKTKENAKIAREASGLSDNIKDSAEKGSGQMDQMMAAVKEINDASGEIEKVIKVIDDIAFQTNILALNAAVEAARAGSAGKGFAVVAEEVRNLAGKSADAAKTTGVLIENSVNKANLGLHIATETSASLKEIVEGINHSAEIITNIAMSSDEQASAIQQVNTGIDQVAQVVQQNSATAEESAAASEEMSGQSDMLDQLISQFKIKDDGGYSSFGYEAPKKKLSAPAKSASTYQPTGDYGKY